MQYKPHFLALAATLTLAACDGNLSNAVENVENDEPTEIASGELTITSPLALDRSACAPGETVQAIVTYINQSSATVQVAGLRIEARPVDGSSDPVPFSPALGEAPVAPGEPLTLQASGTFEGETGDWEVVSTWQDASGRWLESPATRLTIVEQSPEEAPEETPEETPEVAPETPGPTDRVNAGGDWLHTEGSKIVKADGSVWVGRGVNLHDTRGCNSCTWNAPEVDEVKRRIDEAVDVWGVDFIRLDLESYGAAGGRVHWKPVSQDPEYLADVLEIVRYIQSKPGVYVLLSLWIDTGHDAKGRPTALTATHWQILASELANDPKVMFGLVNEPKDNWHGQDDAPVWQQMNDTVQAIRDVEDSLGSPHHLVVVQGTGGWARLLDYYTTHPITAGGGVNIAYETHVYNGASEFEMLFEGPARQIPVIIGEFGPSQGATLASTEALMDRAEAAQVPYLAWTFHHKCPPNLLEDTSTNACGVEMPLTPTAWGQQLKDRLAQPVQQP